MPPEFFAERFAVEVRLWRASDQRWRFGESVLFARYFVGTCPPTGHDPEVYARSADRTRLVPDKKSGFSSHEHAWGCLQTNFLSNICVKKKIEKITRSSVSPCVAIESAREMPQKSIFALNYFRLLACFCLKNFRYICRGVVAPSFSILYSASLSQYREHENRSTDP